MLTMTLASLTLGLAALTAADVVAPGAPVPPPAPTVVSGDNLVTQGIPPLAESVADAARAYGESRQAGLLDWHPQRREMLISTRFADTAQVHRVSFPGGARRQLTFFPDRIAGARYSPDPQRAARFFVFSKDAGGGEFFQIYRHDFLGNGGKITLLTDGKSRNTMGPFSRAGDRLAYTSTRRNGKDTDLYVIDPDDVHSDRLLAQVDGGGWAPLDWSPDGKRLLVEQEISVNLGHLWIFDTTTGERTLLTPKAATDALPVRYTDGHFSNDGKSVYTTTDKDSEYLRLVTIDLETKVHRPLTAHINWDIHEFAVSRDGRTIAVVANEEGLGVLHLLDGRTGRERPQPKLVGSVGRLVWHANNHELGFQLGTSQGPSDVFSLDARTGKVDRWTDSETGGLDTSGAREPELVHWKSFDGRSIGGYLYRPAARFTGPRPLIINIHGGPEGQFRPGFLGRNRYLLEELGVAILFPNVRGSTGYGKSFTKLDNGVLREDSVKDIGALLDWVPSQPLLDAGRVMITGGSYGGYMTFASAYHYSARIRCALAVVGISNFISFLERTEAYRRDLRRVEYGDEREPQMRAFFQQISPLFHAAEIKKPIFIVQGKNDPRVPLAEAEQIVATLKQQSTPVWYLMAKDEGHGFTKKKNADFQFFATIAFIQKFLLQ